MLQAAGSSVEAVIRCSDGSEISGPKYRLTRSYLFIRILPNPAMFVLAHHYLNQHLFEWEPNLFIVCKLHQVKLPKVASEVPTWYPGPNRVPHGKAGFIVDSSVPPRLVSLLLHLASH